MTTLDRDYIRSERDHVISVIPREFTCARCKPVGDGIGDWS